MTTASCVAQARKMNHQAIAARRAGNLVAAAFARDLRAINMQHAAICWINGR